MGGPEYQPSGEVDITRALAEAREKARHVLVLVESNDGMAGRVVESLPPETIPPRRAVGGAATQGSMACVADALDLEHLEGRAIVIENAQWCDPTSMGRLQRLLASDGDPVVAVVAHTDLREEDRWWLDGLDAAARANGDVIALRLPDSEKTSSGTLSEDWALDLAVAARLVAIPLSVPVVAQFLDKSEQEALTAAEELVKRGFLTEERMGFQAGAGSATLDVGEARTGHVAGRLAKAIEDSGEDLSVVGSLHLAAGHAEAAYPLLRDAALAAQARGAQGEAFHLARSALTAATTADIDDDSGAGQLHLACGRYLRAAGRSREAAEHLDLAVGLLDGSARIDALGFAAAVADDLQHPQDADRILAIGEWEAARQGELAKLGSLGTFRARALNRIGFAAESDAVLSKAVGILEEHGSELQLFFSEVNRAWILFDRGQVARAEAAFTHLRDASDRHDLAGLADKEAWRARALFLTGRADDALTAAETARELSAEADVEAPIFLSELALAEGALAFGRNELALEAADRAWDLATRSLPAWENVCRSYRSLALLRLGDVDAASSEIEAALDSTPEGANGWRLRSRCRAIQMEIVAASSRPFPQREAEDLADLFLQSELFGWAAELLCVLAEQGRDKETAREAAALATNLGNPMVAARAAHAGRLWAEPVAGPVIRAVRSIEPNVPSDWRETWSLLPHVAAALDAPEPSLDVAEESDAMEEAMRRAGLADETILSPAQRRSRGLVRHRRTRRRPLIAVAAALGVVAIAAATSFAVAQMNDGEATPTSLPAAASDTLPPTTQPLELEDTAIDVPVELLFGTALDRGDVGRSGYFGVAGPREVDGYYWVFQAADAITSTPLAYGNNLLVGSSDGTYQAIDLTTGQSIWSLPTEDQIDTSGALSIGSTTAGEEAAPAVGGGGGDSGGTVIIVGDDGIVRARDALIVTTTQTWSTSLGSSIKSSPVVVDGVVYVATTDGHVHALDLFNGDVLWRYPNEEGASAGRITADLAYADGYVYAGTVSGSLLLINPDGTLHCQTDLGAPIVANPIVADDKAYVSSGQIIQVLPIGVCEVPVTEAIQFLSETVVDVAPAVVGDLIYIPNADFLNAVDLTAVAAGVSSPEEAHHWSEGKVNADGKIASPPVVTDGAVYFGTETGTVYAVDSDTGDLLWEWETGSYVRASPVVIDGAVYIASGNGNVYAIGPTS